MGVLGFSRWAGALLRSARGLRAAARCVKNCLARVWRKQGMRGFVSTLLGTVSRLSRLGDVRGCSAWASAPTTHCVCMCTGA
eukprot:214562-Chlamydomonas_euryale.AAC.10